MKFLTNSIFLISILTYVLAGTVPVWTCLKENTLHISKLCSLSDEKVDTCCGHKSDAKHNLSSTCCEQFNDLNTSVYNHFLDQNSQVEEIHSLAFHVFDDFCLLNKYPQQIPYTQSPPLRGPPSPLFKLHCSYIC